MIRTTEERAVLDAIVATVDQQVTKAMQKHGPMHSAHEGYAIILEELDEVKEEVWKKNPNRPHLRHELTHVAAMAIRMIYDLTL